MAPLAVPALGSKCARSHSPVVEPAVDDDLHGRIFPEDLKQRPTRFLAGSGDHDEEGTFAVWHAGFSLVRVKITPGAPENSKKYYRAARPAHARWMVPQGVASEKGASPMPGLSRARTGCHDDRPKGEPNRRKALLVRAKAASYRQSLWQTGCTETRI